MLEISEMVMMTVMGRRSEGLKHDTTLEFGGMELTACDDLFAMNSHYKEVTRCNERVLSIFFLMSPLPRTID